VKPGSQSRRFTHIYDTIRVCIEAWEKNKNLHYSISSKETFSIKKVAEMFGRKIKYLPSRKGERYASALTKMSLTNKVHTRYGANKLNDYIKDFIRE